MQFFGDQIEGRSSTSHIDQVAPALPAPTGKRLGNTQYCCAAGLGPRFYCCWRLCTSISQFLEEIFYSRTPLFIHITGGAVYGRALLACRYIDSTHYICAKWGFQSEGQSFSRVRRHSDVVATQGLSHEARQCAFLEVQHPSLCSRYHQETWFKQKYPTSSHKAALVPEVF